MAKPCAQDIVTNNSIPQQTLCLCIHVYLDIKLDTRDFNSAKPSPPNTSWLPIIQYLSNLYVKMVFLYSLVPWYIAAPIPIIIKQLTRSLTCHLSHIVHYTTK